VTRAPIAYVLSAARPPAFVAGERTPAPAPRPLPAHASPTQVSNFLDYFKLEAGKRLDTVRSEVLLPDLVGDVHCIIEAMVGRGGAVSLLPPDLAAAPAGAVLCDADRLRGVLLNLATNAAKFTRAGHIRLRVREVPAEGYPVPPPGHASITIRPVALVPAPALGGRCVGTEGGRSAGVCSSRLPGASEARRCPACRSTLLVEALPAP
jgi:hypothetical protein